MVLFIPQLQSEMRKSLKAILGESVEKRILFLVAEDAEAIGGMYRIT